MGRRSRNPTMVEVGAAAKGIKINLVLPREIISSSLPRATERYTFGDTSVVAEDACQLGKVLE